MTDDDIDRRIRNAKPVNVDVVPDPEARALYECVAMLMLRDTNGRAFRRALVLTIGKVLSGVIDGAPAFAARNHRGENLSDDEEIVRALRGFVTDCKMDEDGAIALASYMFGHATAEVMQR